MKNSIDIEVLKNIFDIIIPGKIDDWPSFTYTYPDNENLYINIQAKNDGCLENIASALTEHPMDEAIRSAERQDAAAFAALYRDLCDAYYSTPSVAAKVAELAERGPHEASPHFEPSLLDKVIATQAGKRRL